MTVLLGLLVSTCACAGTPGRDVILTVHVGAFGGPARAGGGMALSNAPQPGLPITVTGTGGQVTHRTNGEGLATFTVAPGRYLVNSPRCGSGPRSVTVRRVAVIVNVICAVP